MTVVNSATHQVYAVVSGATKRLDPNTGTLSNVAFPGVVQAVHTAANLIYSQSGNATLVIDGATEATLSTLAASGPVATSTIKNHVYVADSSVPNASSVKFFDGSTGVLIGEASIGPSLGSACSPTLTREPFMLSRIQVADRCYTSSMIRLPSAVPGRKVLQVLRDLRALKVLPAHKAQLEQQVLKARKVIPVLPPRRNRSSRASRSRRRISIFTQRNERVLQRRKCRYRHLEPQRSTFDRQCAWEEKFSLNETGNSYAMGFGINLGQASNAMGAFIGYGDGSDANTNFEIVSADQAWPYSSSTTRLHMSNMAATSVSEHQLLTQL